MTWFLQCYTFPLRAKNIFYEDIRLKMLPKLDFYFWEFCEDVSWSPFVWLTRYVMKILLSWSCDHSLQFSEAYLNLIFISGFFFYSLIIFICGWLCKCKTLLTMSLSANATDSWAASLQSCFTSGIFKMFASSFFFWEREIAKLFFPPTKHLLQAGGKVPHTFAHCPSAVCSFVCLLPAALKPARVQNKTINV